MPNLFTPPKKNTDNSSININTASHRRLLERAMPLSSVSDIDVVDGAGNSPLSRKKNRVTINGTINIIGDSLSDAGKEHGKYNQRSSGPITFKTIFKLLSSPKSPNNVFTNSLVWSYDLQPTRQWTDKMDLSAPKAQAFTPGTSGILGGTTEAPGRLPHHDVIQEQKKLPSKSYEIPYIRPRM